MESPVDLLDEINTPFLDLPTCSTTDDDIAPRQPSSVKKFEIQGSDEFKKNVRLAIGELEKINPKFLNFAKGAHINYQRAPSKWNACFLKKTTTRFKQRLMQRGTYYLVCERSLS